MYTVILWASNGCFQYVSDTQPDIASIREASHPWWLIASSIKQKEVECQQQRALIRGALWARVYGFVGSVVRKYMRVLKLIGEGLKRNAKINSFDDTHD